MFLKKKNRSLISASWCFICVHTVFVVVDFYSPSTWRGDVFIQMCKICRLVCMFGGIVGRSLAWLRAALFAIHLVAMAKKKENLVLVIYLCDRYYIFFLVVVAGALQEWHAVLGESLMLLFGRTESQDNSIHFVRR